MSSVERSTEQELPENYGECYSCHYETSALTFYGNQGAGDKCPGLWLCELCASTHSGTAERYPRQYEGGIGTILKTICYVGNVILDEMRKRK